VTMEASIRAVDSQVPSIARIYDYLLGGSTYLEVDRRTCERVSSVYPGGVDAGRANVRANRRFLGRTVRYLVRQAGIRQFLDIGSGLPTEGNVHTVAQDLAPEARVVYVDNDTVVLAHAQDLLRGTSEGSTKFLYQDLRHVDDLLEAAAAELDLDQPVALMLVSILHSIADEDDPHGIVARLLDALPSGSHLVVSHMSSEITPETATLLERLNDHLPETVVDRSRDQITRFFDGLELVAPGIVPVDEWRPAGRTPPVPGGGRPPWYGGMGLKR
jgi:S-adenosyl methyltransferase